MERVAVYGSRAGADLEHVERFMRDLWALQPDTTLISGGADGVDRLAETLWAGKIRSFRVKKKGLEEYAIELWEAENGSFRRIFELIEHPTFQNFASAAFYRTMLGVEEADRVVAFQKPGGSPGTRFTVSLARDWGKEHYVFERRNDVPES